LRPDVAVLDIDLDGELNGVQLGRLLRQAQPDLGVTSGDRRRPVR
jgi:DNA-binding LytR/AlgR family response regulator